MSEGALAVLAWCSLAVALFTSHGWGLYRTYRKLYRLMFDEKLEMLDTIGRLRDEVARLKAEQKEGKLE